MPITADISSANQARRDLAIEWMNRGHALGQRDDSASLPAALAAYDQAITLLQELPVAENPAWANSLAAALMNRGQLLHRVPGLARADEALACLGRAIELLRPLPADGNPWPRRNLAGSHLNRASLLLDLARPADARADALVALQLAAPYERTGLVDADLALKARRALCDAVGHLLVAPGADQEALAREASDLVDDGLALARHWIQLGAPQPRELALRFFRYGARLYRLHQPHFLAEFLLENLAADIPGFQAIAREEIALALRETPGQPYLIMDDPATARRRQLWRELDAVRLQLDLLTATA